MYVCARTQTGGLGSLSWACTECEWALFCVTLQYDRPHAISLMSAFPRSLTAVNKVNNSTQSPDGEITASVSHDPAVQYDVVSSRRLQRKKKPFGLPSTRKSLILLCGHPYRPQHGFCPSVRPSVRPVEAHDSKTKKRKKKHNWCERFPGCSKMVYCKFSCEPNMRVNIGRAFKCRKPVSAIYHVSKNMYQSFYPYFRQMLTIFKTFMLAFKIKQPLKTPPYPKISKLLVYDIAKYFFLNCTN